MPLSFEGWGWAVVGRLDTAATALGSIALARFPVHALFVLRDASIYWQGRGGVCFNGDRPPRYADFAYLSFTVGMAFQVPDTDLKSEALRGTALRQDPAPLPPRSHRPGHHHQRCLRPHPLTGGARCARAVIHRC